MNYDEKCRLLGIERPKHLVESFGKMPKERIRMGKVQRKLSPEIEPPKDLTHLNPQNQPRWQKFRKECELKQSKHTPRTDYLESSSQER